MLNNCVCTSPSPMLYYDDIKPQSRCCLMLIELLQSPIELIFQNSATMCAASPIQTIPSLFVNNELVISDFHEILKYICETNADKVAKQLYPISLDLREKIHERLDFEKNVLHEKYNKLVNDIQNNSIIAKVVTFQREDIESQYDELEQFLCIDIFMAGKVVTIADMAILSTLDALNLIFSFKDDICRWPLLNKWHNIMQDRCFYATSLTGLNKEKDFLFSFHENTTKCTQTYGNKESKSSICICKTKSKTSSIKKN